jgi:predicted transglutaminase-like cysteine proteinase
VGYRKNEGHAVLLAELEGKILVLDSREKRVMEESEYEFTPIYSLDEESAWMHLKGKAKE